MDTKKLRQKILDLAIHGKLVPQDPNDEPASVLLERIRSEKERLVKEGKIKKSKAAKTTDTPHYENVPFEVPDGWGWTTVENICSKIGSGSTPKGSNYAPDGILFFRSQNVYNDGVVLEDIKYISEEVHQSMIGTEVLPNDLLLNITGGSLGRCAIVPNEIDRGNVSQHVCILRPIIIKPEYLHTFILSSFFTKTMKITGSGREGLPKYNLEKMLLPVPPLEEQTRIIHELNKWNDWVIAIDNNQQDLVETIKQTKSKILDLAIHGKLVPQDENDEPASELLKRINPNAEITCDNGQYGKMPKGWCLVTGASLFKQMKSARPKGELFKYIDIDSIDNKSNIVSSIKEIPTIEAPSRASRYTEKGDVVFSMVRPYLRNIARITENDCIASTGFYIYSPYNCMLSKFCYYLMLSNYVVDGLNTFMKGDNSPSITKREIENWLYPLPPMNEQYRIVAKIEEIFTLLDRIELPLRMS